ncbi:MAG: phosphatase PAP2 family protein [Aerococcus sp.]|nr:phosphatase PAP2 family protein [Aerococcus sp.]
MFKEITPFTKKQLGIAGLLLLPFLVFLAWLLIAPDSLYALDYAVNRALRGVPGSSLAGVVGAFTWLGNSYLLIVAAILISFFGRFIKQTHRYSWLGVMTILGPGVLNPLIKALVSRPRPDEALRLVSESGLSFPSGHSMGSVIFFGALAILILKAWQPTPKAKRLFIAGTVVLVVLIALSRLYLSVHFFSDVCAGLSLGSTVLYLGTHFLPIFDRAILPSKK